MLAGLSSIFGVRTGASTVFKVHPIYCPLSAFRVLDRFTMAADLDHLEDFGIITNQQDRMTNNG
jgi:hypothetical protein